VANGVGAIENPKLEVDEEVGANERPEQ